MNALFGSAVFSECGRYRYQLTRELGAAPRSIMWLMLNPSTADATVNDPTVRRCMGFSVQWGFGRMYVCNLYALRSPYPEDLWKVDDPVGPDNDGWIASTSADVIVCAWGVNARPDRVRQVLGLLSAPAMCLGTTKDGFPRHPLYVRGDTELQPLLKSAQEEA